jgi:hypothetical protein
MTPASSEAQWQGPQREARLIGQTLSHYRITAALGAGGMGEVYRATDSTLGRDVAIKVLPLEVSQDPERLGRFRREAHLLASLNHPHIAAIYGLEEADGQPFLVLELVGGEDLAERLERGPIPVEEALEIARQIAEALEEAHEKGIVRRDLKPANVKVTRDGKVRVLDFGLAKAWAGDPVSGSSATCRSPPPSPTPGPRPASSCSWRASADGSGRAAPPLVLGAAQRFEPGAVSGVGWPDRPLGPNEGVHVRIGHRRALKIDPHGRRAGFGPRHLAGRGEEIDHDLVRDAHDAVLLEIVGIDLTGRIVLENRKRPLQALHVFRLGVNEEIDVLRGPLAAMEDDGEAPDQDVAGPGFVEGVADASDVVDRRGADLRAIWLLIHSWASSKVLNR